MLDRTLSAIERRVRPQRSAYPGRVIFLHLAKAAGTTVDAAIETALGRPVKFALSPDASRRAAEGLSLSMEAFRQEMLMYALAHERMDFITGHLPWCRQAEALRRPDDVFVTVLRHPYDRLLSLYYFNRNKPDDRRHFGTDASLSDWLDLMDREIGVSDYARFFSGWTEGELLAEAGSLEAARALGVERAIEAIATLDIVGDVSRMEDFAQRFEAATGCPLRPERRRESPVDYPGWEDQPTEIRDRVAAHAADDLRIYASVFPDLAAR